MSAQLFMLNVNSPVMCVMTGEEFEQFLLDRVSYV